MYTASGTMTSNTTMPKLSSRTASHSGRRMRPRFRRDRSHRTGQDDRPAEREKTGPLRGGGRPEGHPGRQPPGPEDRGRDAVARQLERLGGRRDGRRRGSPLDPLAVQHHEQEARHDERGDEDVEHRHARLHEVQALGRQEHARDTCPPRILEQLQREQRDQEHRRRPEDGRRDSPSERPVPEDRLAAGDDPAAERWMHGERLLSGVLEAALLVREAGVEAAVLRVVRLVEHVRVRRGEVVHAQAARQGRHGREDQPDPQAPGRPRPGVPLGPGSPDGEGLVVPALGPEVLASRHDVRA